MTLDLHIFHDTKRNTALFFKEMIEWFPKYILAFAKNNQWKTRLLDAEACAVFIQKFQKQLIYIYFL